MQEAPRSPHGSDIEEARIVLLDAIALLGRVEIEKGDALVGSARLVELSGDALRLGEFILEWARIELRLAEQALHAVGIVSSAASERPLRMILDEWRESERRRTAAPERSDTAQDAGPDAWELHREYAEVARRLRQRLESGGEG